MVQRFASNVCGLTRRIHERSRKCVFDTISPTPSITEFAGLLPRGCDVETLDAPKRLTSAGCHHRSLSAYFQLDAWREPLGLHQEEPQCRSAWARMYPSRCDYPTLTPVTSCPASPTASATSTRAMSSMGTSREYVTVLNRFPPPH
jgi:hypothetical protein